MIMTSLGSTLKTAIQPVLGNSAAFGAAARAMSELGVAGCIGAACVHQKYLTPEMVSSLSKTTFSILLPCFLGTGILRTIATQGLPLSSLGIPITAVLHAFTMFLLSKTLILPLFGMDPDSDEGRSTALSCSWGNSGTVPLIFLEALFRHNPTVLAECYSLVSLYLVGWSPFFWSYGRSILMGSVTTDVERAESVSTSSISSGKDELVAKLKRLFPPPVIGVFLGMFLALTPLRPLILSSTEGKSAPLSVIYNSFQNLGRAANPLAVLVLTSSLAQGVLKKRDTNEDGTPQEESAETIAMGKKRWGSVAMARFLVSPLLMLGIMQAFTQIHLLPSLQANPIAWFVLMMESCMPPAQNSVLMLQVADKADEASRMARFLFAMYATSMIPVVIVVSIALNVCKLT